MANEIRVRANFVAGQLSSAMLTGDTTIQGAGLADLPAIGASEFAPIAIFRTDNAGRVTQKEIVWVTAHTAGATTATATRGREGTTAQAWNVGDRFSHTDTALDNTIVCTEATKPATPFEGLACYCRDSKVTYIWNGAQWDPIGGLKKYVKATATGTGSTSSASYVDVPGAIDLAFTKRAAHTALAMWGTMTQYVSGPGLTAHGVLINGVDYSVGDFYFNDASKHHTIGMGNIIAAGLAAGNYNARLRWRIVSGGISQNVDNNDVANYFIEEVLP